VCSETKLTYISLLVVTFATRVTIASRTSVLFLHGRVVVYTLYVLMVIPAYITIFQDLPDRTLSYPAEPVEDNGGTLFGQRSVQLQGSQSRRGRSTGRE